MSEEAMLVEEALAGSVPAFEKLVSLYSKKIYNYCYRMAGNKEDAEDILQDVFVKAYRSLNGFRRNSQFSTWLYRIAYNACIDHHRKKKIVTVPVLGVDEEGRQLVTEIASDGPSLEEQVLSNERKLAVQKAIAKLRPEYRTVILLREIDGLSYDEIACVLNIPLGTVKSYISRARETLRASLIHEFGKGGN
jgi:RNA polymerase sigma-70 factor (ECF subfamily)